MGKWRQDLAPFAPTSSKWPRFPASKKLGAQVIVAKIVIHMSRFPSGGHLISWPGISLRKGESFKTTLMQRA